MLAKGIERRSTSGFPNTARTSSGVATFLGRPAGLPVGVYLLGTGAHPPALRAPAEIRHEVAVLAVKAETRMSRAVQGRLLPDLGLNCTVSKPFRKIEYAVLRTEDAAAGLNLAVVTCLRYNPQLIPYCELAHVIEGCRIRGNHPIRVRVDVVRPVESSRKGWAASGSLFGKPESYGGRNGNGSAAGNRYLDGSGSNVNLHYWISAAT